jgi:hypothetical protein
VTGGTERVQLELGQPHDEVKVEVIGGARTIRIERPREAAIRLHVMGGAAGIELDGQVVSAAGGQTTLQSAGWTGRGDRYLVEVIGGSMTIEIVGR